MGGICITSPQLLGVICGTCFARSLVEGAVGWLSSSSECSAVLLTFFACAA